MTLNIFKEIVQLRNYSEGFIRVSQNSYEMLLSAVY